MPKKSLIFQIIGRFRKLSMVKSVFFGLIILCLYFAIPLLSMSNSPTPPSVMVTSSTTNTTLNTALNTAIHNTTLKNCTSKDAPSSVNLGDVKYVKMCSPEFSEDMLDSNFEACFFSKSSSFIHSFLSALNIRKTSESKKHPLINTYLRFSKLSHELKIESVIIEPSLLFCILSPSLKNLLTRRNFTVADKTSDYVLSLGILQKDADILEKKDVQDRFAKSGFQIEVVESPVLSWMKPQKSRNSSTFTSHIFLHKDKWVLHLVVFHERSNYLWHAALLSKPDSRTPTKENLLFVDADSAFENFTAIQLGFKDPRLKTVNIPTKPASFLYQIETSRFLECNETIVNLFKRQPKTKQPTQHEWSNLSPKAFNQRIAIAIEELKINLDPLLIRFWLWSGTLLGWHRQCDIIPYTSDVDFASWATDGEEVDKIINNFKQNEFLTVIEKYGIAEAGLEYKFKCQGLAVDLFFIYEQENGTWCGSHGKPGSGYYIQYHYPSFTLCSAELLGQRVNLPCEPEGVNLADYGPNWMQPVANWNYERSVFNRGPDIFWEKTLLDKVYVKF